MSIRILQVLANVKKWLSKAYPLWDNKLKASEQYDLLTNDHEYMVFRSEIQRRVLERAALVNVPVGSKTSHILHALHENGMPFLNVYETVLTFLLDINAPHSCFVWILYYHNDIDDDGLDRLLKWAQSNDQEIRRYPERLPCLTPYLKMRCSRFDYINSPYWDDIRFEARRKGVI